MKTIVACIDFSDVTDSVVNTAAALAKALGARLVLCHSVPIQVPVVMYAEVPGPIQDVGHDHARATDRLNDIEERLRGTGVDTTQLIDDGGNVSNLLSMIDLYNPDLIVLGSHGHGALYHLLTGSTAYQIIRKANCPVVVVPSRAAHKLAPTGAVTAGADST